LVDTFRLVYLDLVDSVGVKDFVDSVEMIDLIGFVGVEDLDLVDSVGQVDLDLVDSVGQVDFDLVDSVGVVNFRNHISQNQKNQKRNYILKTIEKTII
jgi:hypothetical protein